MNSNLISVMDEYPVEIATSSQILATSDYAANVCKQCATFFALYRIIVTCYTGTFYAEYYTHH